MAQRVLDWLRKYYRRDTESGVWLNEGVEYQIGNTANYLLTISMLSGSNLRHLCQKILPRAYFDGPLLIGAEGHPIATSGAEVIRCWKESNNGDTAVHIALLVDSRCSKVRLEMQCSSLVSVADAASDTSDDSIEVAAFVSGTKPERNHSTSVAAVELKRELLGSTAQATGSNSRFTRKVEVVVRCM